MIIDYWDPLEVKGLKTGDITRTLAAIYSGTPIEIANLEIKEKLRDIQQNKRGRKRYGNKQRK